MAAAALAPLKIRVDVAVHEVLPARSDFDGPR
jgi:hypothetical protein